MTATILFYGAAYPEYRFLSNFYVSPFRDEGGEFWRSVEHYYQAHKTLDANQREAIRKASTSSEAKTKGSWCSLREDWEDVKLDVMRKALRFKFTSSEGLKWDLLATGDDVLIEASPVDSYWGWGKYHTGQNWLGKLLMELREELRNSDP